MNTYIPGLPLNFHAGLPVALHMTVSRPGWPIHTDTLLKGVKEN